MDDDVMGPHRVKKLNKTQCRHFLSKAVWAVCSGQSESFPPVWEAQVRIRRSDPSTRASVSHVTFVLLMQQL